MRKNILKISLLSLSLILLSACTFAGDSTPWITGTPGFLMGVWHGMVAPYTLIVRFFLEIKMYAIPNSGFGYDIGFLVGILAALPIGWVATLISVAFFFFG